MGALAEMGRSEMVERVLAGREAMARRIVGVVVNRTMLSSLISRSAALCGRWHEVEGG